MRRFLSFRDFDWLLLGFVLMGRFLEDRARSRTGRALQELAQLQPDQALLLLGLLATGLYLARAPISMAIAKRMAAQRLASDPLKNLPDGLHVAICGAGSPMPDDQRGGPCTLVMAGQQMFVFDTGNTSARNINKMGFNAGLIDGIFITHFHSDHIDGLGELMLQRWVSKPNSTPVPVYGPAGIDTVVNGFLQAYTLDRGYRVAHHSPKIMPPGGSGGKGMPFALHPRGQGDPQRDHDGGEVRA